MAQDLKDLINALFDCLASAPSPMLYETISNSLAVIGAKQPALFLTVAHGYLLQHNKLSDSNRAFILNAITKVLEGPRVLDDCEEQQALLIINLVIQEMTMTKESEEACANAARDVLVMFAGSDRFVAAVMDAILGKFPAGLPTSPHKYVVLTMAAISKHNAIGFRPFLTDILSRTAPLLVYLKHDPIRTVWSQALCSFSDAVVEWQSPISSGVNGSASTVTFISHDDSSSTITKSEYGDSEYSDQFETIYEIVFNWTSSKDSKCRADAAECVGTLCQMIPKQRVNRDLKKVVLMFLGVYKKTTVLSETFSITKGIANFLTACCTEDTFNVEQYLDDIFNAFFPHVCVVTEQSLSEDASGTSLNVTQINIRNEAFRCFQIASRRFADRQVYYLLHKMQNDKDSVKLGATNLMRHLLNSAGSQMDDKRSLITMGLKPLLIDETLSVRVKMSICQLCVALADHGYVHAEAGGEHVIQFLLTNLILKADPLAASSRKSMSGVDAISLNQLHSQCSQALHTIANTCPSSFNLLWPLLFEYICVDAYTPVIIDLMKCLRILTLKARNDGQDLDFEFEMTPRMATPYQVMARLFVCMNGAPLNSATQKRAAEALKVFREICTWFGKLVPTVVKEQLPQMLTAVEDAAGFSSPVSADKTRVTLNNNNYLSKDYNYGAPMQRRANYASMELKCARTQRWQAHILEFLNACVCAENDGEWRRSLAAAMSEQFHMYNECSHDKAFLMRCLAQTLSRISNTAFVVEKMTLMFDATTHSNQIERVGCAMAVGHCAQTHTDLMLTELANFCKGESLRRSGGAGLFSLLKDAMPYGKSTDLELIHLRATLVLCYGYIVYFCPIESVVQRIEETVLKFLRQYVENCKDVVIREAHLETINLIALTVHPQHLNSDYSFESRYECFSYIKRYVQSEHPEVLSSWIRLLAAKATASLVQLEPPIGENELRDVGGVLTQQTFPIGREKSGLKTLDPLNVSGFLLSPLISTAHLPSGVSGSAATYPFEKCAFGVLRRRFPSAMLPPPPQVASGGDTKPKKPDDSGSTTPEPEDIKTTAIGSTAERLRVAVAITAATEQPERRRRSSLSAVASAVTNGLSGITGGVGSCHHVAPLVGSTFKTIPVASSPLRIDDDEASTVMDATVMQYRNAIGHVVARQPLVSTVKQLLKMFVDYFGSPTDHERTRAIDSTCLILTIYAENAADCTLGVAQDFPPLPDLLGRLAPRLSDSLYAVRALSVRAIWLVFKLSLLLRGHSPQETDLVDSALFDPNAFIDDFLGDEGKMDAPNCRLAIEAISKEIEKRLPQSQMESYVSVLFSMLADRQKNVSSSAAQLLCALMENRGHWMHDENEKSVWIEALKKFQ